MVFLIDTKMNKSYYYSVVGRSTDRNRMQGEKMRTIEKYDVNAKEDIRLKILDHTCELMIHKGIKETTLKDIADSVGISKGTLYYYYAAKEDIIYDIAESHLNKITDELMQWIEEMDYQLSPEQILMTVFDKILSAETRGKLNLYLVGNAITNNPSLRIKFAEKYSQWQQTIQLGLEKIHYVGETKCAFSDSRSISFLILATLDGLIIQRLVGTSQIEIKEIVSLIVKSNY